MIPNMPSFLENHSPLGWWKLGLLEAAGSPPIPFSFLASEENDLHVIANLHPLRSTPTYLCSSNAALPPHLLKIRNSLA
jgi:hypothetical protein